MVFKLTRRIELLKMNFLSYAQFFSGRANFFRIATLACYMGFWASAWRLLLIHGIGKWTTQWGGDCMFGWYIGSSPNSCE